MCIEPPRPPRAAVDAPEQLGHHVLRRRAAHERVAVRAVGRDQVVARRAAPARCRRSSPPRRSTGAGSRRPSPARTSRPRAPRSGGSASSWPATRARRRARAGCGHQCSTVLQRAMNSSASSCARSARSARASCDAACGGRSQNSTTSPLSTSTTSMWSTRAASASSAGVQPAARDDQPVGVVGLHRATARLRRRARMCAGGLLERALAEEHALADDAARARR